MFRNTLAQAARLLVSQGYSFLLAPIMIGRLGLTLFGVWTVVGAVVSYASVLDAGVTRALARFIALYDARGEAQAIRECVGLGLCAFTLLGVLLVPLAWFTAPLAVDALGHVTDGQMRQILLASAVIFVVQGYSAVLQALAHGLRRMVPPNVAVVSGNTVNFGASVVALLASGSLAPYAWANAGAETVSALFVLGSVRYVWRTRIAVLPSRERIRSVLGFSLQSQLGWIADLINLQTDKIVIGLLVSAQAAGTYQIGSSVAGAVRTLGAVTASAMIPTATAAIARDGRHAVSRIVLHYLPRTLGIALPIFMLSGLAAPFLFVAWIGERTGGVIAVMIALNIAYALNILTAVPSTVAIADGRPGFVSRNSLWMAALNVALTLALAPAFGLGGVVAGTIVAVGGVSIVFVVAFARSYEISASDLRDAIVPSALLSVVVAVPFAPLVLATRHLGETRLSATALLLALALCYGAVYWPLASRIGVLPHRLTFRRALSRSAAL